MDLPNEAREPLPPQLPCRGRGSLGLVVLLPRDPEYPAAAVDRYPGVGQAVDHRVEPFGRGLSSPRNFAACRMIATSISSSRIRLRAARSSADSTVVLPGRTPLSMSSWRSHFDSVTGWIPSSSAVCFACLPARAQSLARGTPAVSDGACHRAFQQGRQLATTTGTPEMGQVKLSPDRAADPMQVNRRSGQHGVAGQAQHGRPVQPRAARRPATRSGR